MGKGKSGGGGSWEAVCSSRGRGWTGELRPGVSVMTRKGAFTTTKWASNDLCYWLDVRPKRT